jgi:hypothetical protein
MICDASGAGVLVYVKRMPAVRLKIEPELVGPISIGTVAVIRALCDHLQLSLAEAIGHVNRCVFDAEIVTVPAPSVAAARAAVAAIQALERVPAIEVGVVTAP